jgi:phthalate 4,5-dioxygenase reductase subunit
MQLRVTRTEILADGIHGFEFRRPDGSDLPEFTAGSHVSVTIPGGLIRKYSLCNDPAERDRYEIAVKSDPQGGGGSISMTGRVKVGDAIEVSEPVSNFALSERAASHTFIVGGIGITPIMSMIRHLKSSGGKPFRLYYCTRSPQATAFRDELSAPPLGGVVRIHHDGGNPDNALDFWPILEQPKGHVYCCGPRGLMEAVRDMTGHWSPAAIHFEAFTEPERSKPEDRPFRIRLARTGTVLDVPVGATILEVLRAAGHDAPSSCESGTCGTCKTRLLSGKADHRDLVLTEAERDSHIMICVSRASTPELTIDR